MKLNLFPSSERHHIDASSWHELTQKIRFTAFSGRKDTKENLAFLPTKIVDIDSDGSIPINAQWNYKILCHPTKHDIPLTYLRLVDDLSK